MISAGLATLTAVPFGGLDDFSPESVPRAGRRRGGDRRDGTGRVGVDLDMPRLDGADAARTGLANQEIARRLFLSTKTVQNHVRAIRARDTGLAVGREGMPRRGRTV